MAKYVLGQVTRPLCSNLSVRSRKACVTFAASFFLMFLLVIASPAWAKNLYVDVAGVHGSCSDSVTYANNNQTHPWCTIQKAADNVQAGDTVIVADGTYTDTNRDGYIVWLQRGGSSAAPITFQAENKWGAILDGQSLATNFGFIIGAYGGSAISYINVIGFEAKNFRYSGFGIPNNSPCSYITYKNNKVHGIGQTQIQCTDSDANQGHVAFGSGDHATYITYDSNVVYDIGRLPGGCSSPSQSDYARDHGIYSQSSHVVVMNNIFWNCLAGFAIQIRGDLVSVSNWDVINNTFGGPTPNTYFRSYGWAAPIISEGASNVNIQNNISYNPGNGLVYFDTSAGSGIAIKNNLIYGGSSVKVGQSPSYTSSGNLVGSSYNPQFVNVSTYDYHLQSGSPAIDKGIYYVGYDADDNTRVGNPDIGAYEYGSAGASTPPSAPAPTPAPAPAADTTPPSAPAGITASAVSSTQINLSWMASSDNVGVTGYRIYRNGTQLATTAGTSSANTGLTPSTAYTYAVSAIDAAGNASAKSPQVSATTQAATATTAPTGSVMPISPATSGLIWDDTYKRLGVGTVSPGATLDIIGAHVSGTGMARYTGAAQYGFMSADTTTNGLADEAGFLVKLGGTLTGQFGARKEDNAVYIKNRIYGTADIITMASNGNVGVGTTTPTETLEVNGGIRINPAVLKPVCDSNARGTFWYTQGTSNDIVQVCAMVNGSLVWKALW
jgi:hypothetical protein